jgi:hypothetical protein
MQMNPGPAKKRFERRMMMPDMAWNQMLRDHQKRVDHMKPAVVIAEPWRGLHHKPSRPLSARDAGRPAPRAAGGSPSRSPRRDEVTPRGKQAADRPAAAAAAGRPTSGRPLTARLRNAVAHAKPVRAIDTLPEDQRYLCEEMVDFLLTLRTEECQSVVDQLFELTEERRLLRAYSGVFPTLALEPASPAAAESAEHVAAPESPFSRRC